MRTLTECQSDKYYVDRFRWRRLIPKISVTKESEDDDIALASNANILNLELNQFVLRTNKLEIRILNMSTTF